jgi:heavy metal sensor kinase
VVKYRSIRWRLTAWYCGVLALTFFVAASGVWWSIRNSIHETVDEDLRARWKFVLESLAHQPEKQSFEPLAQELAEQAEMAPAEVRYRIADSTGHWLYASAGTECWASSAPDPQRLPARGSTAILGTGRRPFRVLSAAVPGGLVQIGMPLHEYYEMLDHFTWSALLASPALLLLASLGGYWMSRRALAPVDQITTAAAEIEAQNLSRRLRLSGTGDELDRLSETLNSMFGRLETSFRRMAQFTADASHELRTPVAIIRTTVEVTRAKPRTPEQYQEALDRILGESERMTALIEDLMVLARADAGVDGVALEPIDLAGVLRDQCAKVQVLAESSGVRLSSNLPARCELPGEAMMLGRLFLILLDNAIRYTPARGEVSVSLDLDSANGVAIGIVRDTGIGIGPEDLPHVFERFYRAAKDRSRESGGTGLGLSIAQWIAQRHGGAILAQSAVGTGSTFYVRLPLA